MAASQVEFHLLLSSSEDIITKPFLLVFNKIDIYGGVDKPFIEAMFGLEDIKKENKKFEFIYCSAG